MPGTGLFTEGFEDGALGLVGVAEGAGQDFIADGDDGDAATYHGGRRGDEVVANDVLDAAANTGGTITSGKLLTIDTNNANRSINMTGNLVVSTTSSTQYR